MEILAKAAPLEEQIEDKINKGCDGIELQLLSDFLDDNYDAKYFYDKISSINNLDIKVVHLPIIQGQDLNLELFSYYTYKKAFLKAVKLSQMFSNLYNHNMIIVIHNGFTLNQYFQIPSLLYFIEELFEECLDRYPNVEYAFENILPFIVDKNRIPVSRNGYLYDNVDLAIYFNKRFSTKAFGTVVDTCHIMICERIIKSVFADYYKDISKCINLEKVFEKNKDVVKIFHLANAINLGYNKGEHGCCFEENETDNDFLEYFFNLYYKHIKRAYITLEVYEENYSDSKNYFKTKKHVERYIK